MPETLTETDVFPATITVPEDGDPRNAASVRGPFVDLTNRTRHLSGRVDRAYQHVLGAGPTATYSLPLHFTTNWDAGAGVPGFALDALGSAVDFKPVQWSNVLAVAVFNLDLPHGAVIDHASVVVDPVGGHGDLPQYPPKWDLLVAPSSGATPTIIASGTDAPANVAAYEAEHAITAPSFTHAIDRDNGYALKFYGEKGTNSIAGLKIRRILVHLHTP